MVGILSALLFSSIALGSIHPLALEHQENLRLSTYLVADHGKAMAGDEASLAASADIIRDLLVSRVIIEVYRGGIELTEDELIALRDFYAGEGFEVMGGIATVPGGDFGVESNHGGYWFNYQAPKTREDLERVCRRAARVFDAFVVDDFLCTQDDSDISVAAKGERSWGEYRRALMTDIARDVIIGLMKEEKAGIHLVVKFPQWYDRFHVFGYDVETLPALFDGVWVGTETRGRDTKRFGYTQSYEGFVNYRWLAGLSGRKIEAAWFDHGDCDAQDFIEQAYTSVLAGAKDLVIFQYGDLKAGHGGHDLLKQGFEELARMAKAVAKHPARGVAAYKPAQSDPSGELYVMDYVGMFGVPLIPTHEFPRKAKSLFLPAHAAHDVEATRRTADFLDKGGNVVMTLGFLADAKGPEMLLKRAGLSKVVRSPIMATGIKAQGGEAQAIEKGLGLEGSMMVDGAAVVLEAVTPDGTVPYLTQMGNVWVWNVHTYSQADFDFVNEMLLSPSELGLLDLDENLAGLLRNAFNGDKGADLKAPSGVTFFDLGEAGVVLQNHNDADAEVRFNGNQVTLGARSRKWLSERE